MRLLLVHRVVVMSMAIWNVVMAVVCLFGFNFVVVNGFVLVLFVWEVNMIEMIMLSSGVVISLFIFDIVVFILVVSFDKWVGAVFSVVLVMGVIMMESFRVNMIILGVICSRLVDVVSMNSVILSVITIGLIVR